jgi:hypothetical protein
MHPVGGVDASAFNAGRDFIFRPNFITALVAGLDANCGPDDQRCYQHLKALQALFEPVKSLRESRMREIVRDFKRARKLKAGVGGWMDLPKALASGFASAPSHARALRK